MLGSDVSELRCFLKNEVDRRKCKTAMHRRDFVEDVFALMPKKELYKKYFPSSKQPVNQCAKLLKRICDYANLSSSLCITDIRNVAKGITRKSRPQLIFPEEKLDMYKVFTMLSFLPGKKQRELLKKYRNCPINWLALDTSKVIFKR